MCISGLKYYNLTFSCYNGPVFVTLLEWSVVEAIVDSDHVHSVTSQCYEVQWWLGLLQLSLLPHSHPYLLKNLIGWYETLEYQVLSTVNTSTHTHVHQYTVSIMIIFYLCIVSPLHCIVFRCERYCYSTTGCTLGAQH